ncbi:hypothetical protein L3X38_022975 [Prunus dulcis]|uniref:Heavy metal transport/detoxification superfamily protein n=1 Tax=Prunus dulcis TaxID=3755 RepID=A0AAD4VXY6_PRUDU|nr:hypothetical protein L3X38_022975 [Prunus dulcis]
MVLKVDLQCHKCYKKVKKVLCKFPQIQDQIYDEKQNQVVIKVVCCSPEKIRDRIRCKGGGAIKCIQIKEKPKEEKPKEEKPKEEKPKTPPPNRGPHTGYGGVALYIQYDGYYGRPVCGSYGGVRSYNTNYCVARSDCFSEENPQGCTVM